MRSYSADLRQRVADAVDRGELSQREIAKRFTVSLSFVVRLLQLRKRTGGLKPKPHGGGAKLKLSKEERILLFKLVRERPDATLEQLKEMGGFDCSPVTIWRTFERAEWTYKKKSPHASERDRPDVKKARAEFRRKVKDIDARRLVFLDETGLNTSMSPTHGWAPKGERVAGSVPKSWTTTTLVSAMALDGVRASMVFPGAIDRAVFDTYVEDVLAPTLHPNDVVVWDNLGVHKSEAAKAAVEKAGAEVLPLPPYSPDYCPIEEMYSKAKNIVRRIAARTTPALYKAVGTALAQITPENIAGWFRHSGLYAMLE
jgi:transposase